MRMYSSFFIRPVLKVTMVFAVVVDSAVDVWWCFTYVRHKTNPVLGIYYYFHFLDECLSLFGLL